MKKCLIAVSSIVYCVFLFFPASSTRAEVASCQAEDQGLITACMEFASGKPIPRQLEKTCTLSGSKNHKWVRNPCPRAGIIGYCEIPRSDIITQVVYCFKRQGIPDKQTVEVCKRSCKGRFAAY